MITKATVLVLGAGVSIPYGYPSGGGLVQDIFQGISNTDWRELYKAFDVTDNEMYALRSELHLSQKPSIDAFLEHRPEFLRAGKLAIALSLLSKEDPDKLSDFDIRDKGIYHFLYNSLAASWEEFKNNKLTIVTFNYDRSLEHFLFTALKHSYNKSDSEIAEAIQSIPIIHVHGSLGPLVWQDQKGNEYYPLFTRKKNPNEIGKKIRDASENIKIVSEAQPKSQEFELAFERIKNAERIYFLGFGYFNVNLERLGLRRLNVFDNSLQNSFHINANTYQDRNGKSHILEIGDPLIVFKHFRGSAFGLGTAQIQAIQNEWRIGLLDNKSNALEFLKEYADLS
jgi:hypothetical protein